MRLPSGLSCPCPAAALSWHRWLARGERLGKLRAASAGSRFPPPPPPPLLSQVLAQRGPWQLEKSPELRAALGFGEGRRQRGAAPPPRRAGDPRGRAGGFSQLLQQRCWRDLLARGGNQIPCPAAGGGRGAGPTPSEPPRTEPSVRGSFGQLRPTPPLPLRPLRAAECPPFTRGRGSRAPLATPDMSVGRFLTDSTPNPHFPGNKSASTAAVGGLSRRGLPRLVLMSSAPSVPLDLGKEGPAVLRAGTRRKPRGCDRSREHSDLARAGVWSGSESACYLPALPGAPSAFVLNKAFFGGSQDVPLPSGRESPGGSTRSWVRGTRGRDEGLWLSGRPPPLRPRLRLALRVSPRPPVHPTHPGWAAGNAALIAKGPAAAGTGLVLTGEDNREESGSGTRRKGAGGGVPPLPVPAWTGGAGRSEAPPRHGESPRG